MKKITSFTQHTTAEGERLTFTYSEITEDGQIAKSNERRTLIVLDENVLDLIHKIRTFLQEKIPK